MHHESFFLRFFFIFTLGFLDLFWQDSAIAFNNSSSSEDLHPNQPTSGWEHLAKIAPLPLCLILFLKS